MSIYSSDEINLEEYLCYQGMLFYDDLSDNMKDIITKIGKNELEKRMKRIGKIEDLVMQKIIKPQFIYEKLNDLVRDSSINESIIQLLDKEEIRQQKSSQMDIFFKQGAQKMKLASSFFRRIYTHMSKERPGGV